MIRWLIVTAPFVAAAQVQIRGIEVQNTTQVLLCWEAATSPYFYEYRLFMSSGGGPFSQIATITNKSQTTYLYSGGSSLSSPLRFLIAQVDTQGGNLVTYLSDTVTAIAPWVVSVNNNVITIAWNKPVAGFSGSFTIYRDINGGGIAVAGNVPTGVYAFTDTVPGCSGNVTYIVEATWSGCLFRSFPVSTTFEDHSAPPAPFLDSVSISPAGTFMLGWERPVGDVAGYYVLLNQGGNWNIIATVTDPAITFYDSGILVTGPVSGGVAAFDACVWNGSPNTSAMSSPHTSMFLQVTYDTCGRQLILKWNEYGGWQVHSYHVFHSLNGGQFSKVASLPAGSTQWTYPLQAGGNHCFFVRAEGGDATSSSNVSCINIPEEHVDGVITIFSASYVGDSGVKILFGTGKSALTLSYSIYESENEGGEWKKIQSIIQNPDNDSIFEVYAGTVPQPGKIFKVVGEDKCSGTPLSSGIVRPIFLSIDGNNEDIFLKWSEYLGKPPGTYLAPYSAVRIPYEDTIVTTGATTWTDHLFEFPPAEESRQDTYVCYQVRSTIIGSGGSSFTITSNTACIKPAPLLWLPNAFTPDGDGINDILHPKGLFLENGYEMYVFNRFGNMVYHDTNGKGWDGSDAPEGIYVVVLHVPSRKMWIRQYVVLMR